jgi:hypothetical protein
MSDQIRHEQDLRRQLGPGEVLIVGDAPLSADNYQSLKEAARGVPEYVNEASKLGKVTRVLARSDASAFERHAEIWRDLLLPVFQARTAAPAKEPLLDLINDTPSTFSGVHSLALVNLAKRDLKDIALEFKLENEWGDKVVHYRFLPLLRQKGRVSFSLGPWWPQDYSYFSDKLTVTWSAWTSDAKMVDSTSKFEGRVKLDNLEARRAFNLKADKQEFELGLKIADWLQTVLPAPLDPIKQRDTLKAAMSGGDAAVFEYPVGDKKTLAAVRITRPIDAQGGFIAEILEADRPSTARKLKGTVGSSEQFGAVLYLQEPVRQGTMITSWLTYQVRFDAAGTAVFVDNDSKGVGIKLASKKVR